MFISSRNNAAVESHTLPAQDGKLAEQPLPVAYSFTSFGPDKLLIPTWVRKIGALHLFVDSKATSVTTYITKVRIAYDLPQRGRVAESATILGGSSANFNLPLNATNLVFEAEFINIGKNETLTRQWRAPLSQWVGGKRTIDITGTWPGSPSIRVVEEE